MLRLRRQAQIKKDIIRTRIFLFIIMYLVFITAYFSLNTFSKYIGVSEGDGDVQVAKWEVSCTSSSDPMMNIIAGNTTDTYDIKVTSTSDVGCSYSIVISNIPNGVKVKLNSGEFQTATNGKLTFNNIGHFDAGSSGAEDNYTLTMEADISTGTLSNHKVNIDVAFVQDAL